MSTEAKNRTQSNHINRLSDELLMEILRRLPDCKFVIQCKCVCKRWAVMASDPWFISQFIAIKSGGGLHQNLSIVTWYTPDFYRDLWMGSESFFKPSIFKAQNSTFSPFLFPDSSAKPVASCNDLLLYSRRHVRDAKYDHYIRNVQTRQWIQLPSPPYYYGRCLLYGLICDPPLFSCHRETATYRYTVVVMRPGRPSAKLTAHIFSSTSQCQWSDRVLSLPRTCELLGTGLRAGFWFGSGFCFDDKLHFTCREGFFGFDQNSIESDDEIQCHLVHWPLGMLYYSFHVGVSQEHLKLCTLLEDVGLHVWILKDYSKSIWMLQHKVESPEWVSRDSWLMKNLDMFPELQTMPTNVLGFHPRNSDVIYVIVPGGILSCNLSSRTLELACHIPVAAAEGRTPKHYLSTLVDFPLMIPIWPTPLPHHSSGC
ncbi:hypothetical protein vseg_018042 [Gypsophila vaccaria]